jgi:flavodoxin
MKTLIVYYSKTGNTEKVAEELTKVLGAEIEEIIDKKNRAGLLNWFRSGRDGMKKAGTEIGESAKNPQDFDLVILGSPIWGWNMAPAVRTYVEKNRDKIKEYAFFVTSGNTEVSKITPYFSEIMGRESLAQVGFNAREMKDQNLHAEKISEFIDSLKERL